MTACGQPSLRTALAADDDGVRRIAALCAVALVGGMVATPNAVAKPPAGACNSADPGMQTVSTVPWAQRLFDPRRAVWPHSTGRGVLVAVVGSGVDADHPQLRGAVRRGADFHFEGSLPGNFDCDSQGTAVASLIAARPRAGVGFAGLAPGAEVLPVRVSDRSATAFGPGEQVTSRHVASGIRYAAEQGADVIVVTLASAHSIARVRAAVEYARKKDAVVVAAVGNASDEAAGASYPAGYPGVLGVAAVDTRGALDQSRLSPHTDVVAPGADVLAAARERGHNYYSGSEYAAGFVAATAALVRAQHPTMKAAKVVQRILATTDPSRGFGYGEGAVNPHRALTDKLVDDDPVPLAAMKPRTVDPAYEAAVSWWRRAGSIAMAVTGLLVLGAVLGLVLVPSLRRAQRRRWLPSRAAPVPTERVVEGPPDEVFLLPRPEAER